MEHCSILSADRGESMAGTAFAETGLLLVEQPGAWGRRGLADSDFDPEIAEELQRRADAAGLRLLAIRRSAVARPKRRSWGVRLQGEGTTYWGLYDDDADLVDLPLDPTVAGVGQPAEQPTYLVCTHARRDACCAVFGRPVEATLEALRPGLVWGCSHTGGHRFAPVVITLPDGAASMMYGRVAPSVLDDLVAATDAGRVLPELLRGPNGRPAFVQAALVDALRDHPVPGDWRSGRIEPDGEDRWYVELNGHGSRTVLVTAETVAEPMVSCGKPDPSAQTHFRVEHAGSLPRLRHR